MNTTKTILTTLCFCMLISFSNMHADISPKTGQRLLWFMSPSLVKQQEREFRIISAVLGGLCTIGAIKTGYETAKFSKKLLQNNPDSEVKAPIHRRLAAAGIIAVPGCLITAGLAFLAKNAFTCAQEGLFTELPNWMKF